MSVLSHANLITAVSSAQGPHALIGDELQALLAIQPSIENQSRRSAPSNCRIFYFNLAFGILARNGFLTTCTGVKSAHKMTPC